MYAIVHTRASMKRKSFTANRTLTDAPTFTDQEKHKAKPEALWDKSEFDDAANLSKYNAHIELRGAADRLRARLDRRWLVERLPTPARRFA
jgi:hypothetical protein